MNLAVQVPSSSMNLVTLHCRHAVQLSCTLWSTQLSGLIAQACGIFLRIAARCLLCKHKIKAMMQKGFQASDTLMLVAHANSAQHLCPVNASEPRVLLLWREYVCHARMSLYAGPTILHNAVSKQ